MTKERAWPARAMYILIAAALAISLILTGAINRQVSANPGLSEWTRVNTPTTDDFLLTPASDIIDYAVADGGEVAYAVWENISLAGTFYLLKSEDGAATWDDISDALEDVDEGNTIGDMYLVATDGVDSDFVAVALNEAGALQVYISDDGGDTFEDTGLDGTFIAYELEVSPEVAGERNLAIGGQSGGTAVLYRSTATGDSASSWEDATTYGTDWQAGAAVVDIKFAPSWSADWTVLVATVTDGAPDVLYLQFGSWGTSEGWNLDSILAIDPVAVVSSANVPTLSDIPWGMLGRFTAGITLPMDYSGRNSDKRYVWVNVNYYDAGNSVGKIFRVKNKSVMAVNQQIDGTPWLTNVHYLGYIAEGKAIAGLLGSGDSNVNNGYTLCCEGVDVYRNMQITNMDICCLPWEEACKPPTGTYAMEVVYVSADKAYAVALVSQNDGRSEYDEGAWSVSFDDGDVWNQLSLVDTFIHYFSDFAVSPDCNKHWVVSVNTDMGCFCDSVWLYGDELPEEGYSEYSDHWIRVWCGSLDENWGMLRLNPEETTGDTVYLVDEGTDNVYWNELEGLACWDFGSASVDEIVDLAVLDKETIFALDYDGDVAMSDDFAIGWHEEVDGEVEYGYTIAVWGDNTTHVLVGGRGGEVSYSDDGGETFTALEDIDVGSDSKVTVAFDTYFDTNDTIYAAVEAWDWDAQLKFGGIYSWVIGESEDWTDLKAEPTESQLGLPLDTVGDAADDDYVEVAFTGIVVDRPGNPYTSPENGGVIYASYYGYVAVNATDGYWLTGVARSLEREVTVCTTCLMWDFLWEGLTADIEPWNGVWGPYYPEGFEATTDALKICGCLDPTSNTKLFAIDAWWDYDFEDNDFGSVWTFEDCYAKKAPETVTPEVKADPCSCFSAPFTLTWDPLCDACVYEIQFALDEDFTMPVKVNNEGSPATDYIISGITGDSPSFSVLGGQDGGLSCETTYHWRVRASEAATGQVIHSWWTVGESFTVPPSILASQIELVAPAPGALNVPPKNPGFSWDLLAEANSFNWVLSKNADLSAPVSTKTGLTESATTHSGTLDYGTTYYWQVTAYKDDSIVGVSAIGTFTTAPTGAFCCPIDGLCFDTQAALQAHNADAHPAVPATPVWVWVVIAIGAVLVIVVIVLIFRTRRV